MMEERSASRRTLLAPLLVLLLFAALFAAFASVQLRSMQYLVGDDWFYAATCISLLQDHDLDLRNQLRGSAEFFSSHVALGKDNTWYPKHPILMPLLSVPFLRAFGMKGFLYFNLTVASLAMTLLFLAARRESSGVAAFLACLAVAFGTFVPWYLSEYSPDMLSTCVIAAGMLFLLRMRPAGLDGLFLSLSLLAKPSNVIFWVSGLVVRVLDRKLRPVVLYLALSAPAFAGLAALNQAMFGSPFTTAYNRILMAEKGKVWTRSQSGDFDLPLAQGIRGQLFHPLKGLLPTSPILLASLPGLVAMFARKRRTALALALPCLALFLFFSHYRLWDQSMYGNRFLMAPVLLAAIPMAAGFQWLLDRAGGAGSH